MLELLPGILEIISLLTKTNTLVTRFNDNPLRPETPCPTNSDVTL